METKKTFSDGKKCTAEIDKKSNLPTGNLIWDDGITTCFDEYKEWILSINQIIANKLKKNVGYVVMNKDKKFEFWTIEPNKKPKLVGCY